MNTTTLTHICTQAIHIVAFAHIAISHLISEASSVAVATGMANTLGNKGAVCVSLQIGATKLVVVNAHLAAHQNNVRQRNEQMNKIDRDIAQALLKKIVTSTSTAILSAPLPTRDGTTDNMMQTSGNNAVSATAATAVPGPEDASNKTEALVLDARPIPPTTAEGIATKNEASATQTRPLSTGATPVRHALSQCADSVVVMGDLNYRIRGNRYEEVLCSVR